MSSEEFVDVMNFNELEKKEKRRGPKNNMSSKNNTLSKNNNVSVPKNNLHNDVGIILEDKIKNDQIQLTQFELKTIKKFIEGNKLQNKNSQSLPKQKRENTPRKCYIGVNCITWMCAFEHPPNRKPECSCKENDCVKLHIKDALCKDPFHPDDCTMAHKMSDFINV
jgi:hypothetical protein